MVLHRGILLSICLWAGISLQVSADAGFQTREVNIVIRGGLARYPHPDGLFSKLLCSGYLHNWETISVEQDKSGMLHTRYQQLYRGIPVKDAILILHSEGDTMSRLTGVYIAFGDKQTSFPDSYIAAENITRKFQNTFGTSLTPHREKGWFWIADIVSRKIRLVYMMDYFPRNSMHRHTITIDAATMDLIEEKSNSCFSDVTGMAVTNYYGTQNISCFADSGTFYLKCTNKGQGIYTKNLNNQLHYQQVTEFTDADNYWQISQIASEKYAADAHYCAGKYYDYLSTAFNRNSLDNNGYRLQSYLNYGTSMANAFWNGQAVVYGSGNTVTQPMTTLDIAGHEFTHGLIQKTANLAYSGEPGTVNEAISDIFGTALEFNAGSVQANWNIGEQSGTTLRSMSHPNDFNQPQAYHGLYWYYGTGDQGGVHINSGFINKWFHLLTMGEQGANEFGTPYQVDGIGLDDAISIVYHTLTAYLVPSSGFESFRMYTIQSVIDLYGSCSPEYFSVLNAWEAVNYAVPLDSIQLNVQGVVKLCQGDSIKLAVTHVPGTTYQWFHNNVLLGSETNSEMHVHEEGVWNVVVLHCGTQSYAGNVTIVFHETTTVLTMDVEACMGTSVLLTGFPSGGTFDIPNPYSGPSTSFNYLYTDSNGCSNAASGIVTIHELPDVHFITVPNEYPENYGPVRLEANVAGNFSGVGVSGNYFYPQEAGIGGPYPVYVHFTDHRGCSSGDVINLTVLPPCKKETGDMFIQASAMQQHQGNTITFSVSPDTINFIYSWELPSGFTATGGTHQHRIETTWSGNEGLVKLWLINSCNDSTLLQYYVAALYNEPERSIRLFPNPANSILNIELHGYGSSIETEIVIMDGAGRWIKSMVSTRTKETMDVGEISPGLYILETRNGTRIQRSNLVIN